MKKKSLLLIPALLGLFISSCGGGGGNNEPSVQSSSKAEISSSKAQESSNAVASSSIVQSSSEPANSSSVVPSSSQNSVRPSSSSSEMVQQYTITFKDENDQLLEAKKWNKGAVPSYNYTKNDTQEWDYTVQGWSASLGGSVITVPAVTADATYWAVVNAVKNKYTITFDSNGGSTVSSITADYGTSVSKPTNPKKDNYSFVAWSYDSAGKQVVQWPLTLVKDEKLYANWNETVSIKSYLTTLIQGANHDPFSFIPATMRPTNSKIHVNASEVNYDFTKFNNVNSIKYGGFGEQWQMFVDNITESERFYSILTLGEAVINASVALFNNYLDNNPGDTATHTLNETAYSAKLDFSNGVLSYTIQYKTGINIPFFGEVLPQIDMTYKLEDYSKTVRIQLTENNVMKYVITDNSYVFALQYGISTVSRKSFLQLDKTEEGVVNGQVYEFIQYKDQELVPAVGLFIIDDTYVSVAGNKASGMPGFKGFINELYKTSDAKLLGYEVRETFTKWGIEATYHTLWFNLNNISGINNVKAIKNDETTFGLGANNNHDIYLNNSSSIFEPTYNKVLIKTSRKYDVEMRKQFFYGYNEGNLTKYEVQLPMMFIQADHDGYTNFTDFPKDIKATSGITASVNLSSTYLEKIQSDYATLIDMVISRENGMTGDRITLFIGSPAVI